MAFGISADGDSGCVCCPAACAVPYDNIVKGAEGFDVKRLIFSPYLCKMFAKSQLKQSGSILKYF